MTEIYTLSLLDALPIWARKAQYFFDYDLKLTRALCFIVQVWGGLPLASRGARWLLVLWSFESECLSLIFADRLFFFLYFFYTVFLYAVFCSANTTFGKH